MAKSVETVETLANIGQYSPLVITFIVADRHDPFFFLFFPSQHIRFAETRPFSVFLSFFLRPSFLLLVVNARVYRANNRSSGHTETRGGGGGRTFTARFLLELVARFTQRFHERRLDDSSRR